MGIDPENPDYEPGDECPRCVDVLFDGVTPKYVEADIVDIEDCPASGILVPPNGTYLLTQFAPCEWRYFVDNLLIGWKLEIGQSRLFIGFNPGEWFFALVAHECIDAFANELNCGPGNVFGEKGYVTLWWGPTIGP